MHIAAYVVGALAVVGGLLGAGLGLMLASVFRRDPLEGSLRLAVGTALLALGHAATPVAALALAYHQRDLLALLVAGGSLGVSTGLALLLPGLIESGSRP